MSVMARVSVAVSAGNPLPINGQVSENTSSASESLPLDWEMNKIRLYEYLI